MWLECEGLGIFGFFPSILKPFQIIGRYCQGIQAICNDIRTFLNSWLITSLLRSRQVEIICPAQDVNLHHMGKGSIQTDILHT